MNTHAVTANITVPTKLRTRSKTFSGTKSRTIPNTPPPNTNWANE